MYILYLLLHANKEFGKLPDNYRQPISTFNEWFFWRLSFLPVQVLDSDSKLQEVQLVIQRILLAENEPDIWKEKYEKHVKGEWAQGSLLATVPGQRGRVFAQEAWWFQRRTVKPCNCSALTANKESRGMIQMV
jgi:hypothetical protein